MRANGRQTNFPTTFGAQWSHHDEGDEISCSDPGEKAIKAINDGRENWLFSYTSAVWLSYSKIE
jgi:hypothetical protein